MVLWLAACSSGGGNADAALDSGKDIATDVPVDPGSDLVVDPGSDQAVDTVQDTGPLDPGQDQGIDLPPDAGMDAGQDAAKDTVADDGGDAGNAGPFGFDIRVPQEHEFKCDGGIPGMFDDATFWDADWICTFEYKETSGHVYVQNTPVGCNVMMSPVPDFESPGAWMSVDGVVTAIGVGSYNWGGNHHNDSMEIDYGGNHFKYYHSSIGFGWRKCQDMDCIKVYDQAGQDMVEDGCTKERTLPATCVLIEHDGSVPEFVDVSELPEDQWPCPGDPNYR